MSYLRWAGLNEKEKASKRRKRDSSTSNKPIHLFFPTDFVQCINDKYSTIHSGEIFRVKKMEFSLSTKKQLLTLVTAEGKFFVPPFIKFKADNFVLFRKGDGDVSNEVTIEDAEYLIIQKKRGDVSKSTPISASSFDQVKEIVESLLRGNPKATFRVFRFDQEAFLPELPVEWRSNKSNSN